MKRWYWAGLGVTVVAIASCSDEPLRCGPGTARKGNECSVKGQPAHNAGGSGNSAAGNSADDEGGRAGDHSDGAGGNSDRAAVRDDGGSAGSAGESGAGGSAGAGLAQTDLITSQLACDSHNVTGATVITDPITQDTVWSGLIHLPKGLSMRNEPTLTITPGTKIIVGHDATIEFGWPGGGPATIVAAGTLEQPIMFCGETDTAGYWAAPDLSQRGQERELLKNVLIADAGGTESCVDLGDAAARARRASPEFGHERREHGRLCPEEFHAHRVRAANRRQSH